MSDQTNDTHFRESQEAGGREDDRLARQRFAVLPYRPTTKPRRAYVMKAGELRQKVYGRIAAQFDAMDVDGVLRVPADQAPGANWFFARAKLNGFVIFTKTFNETIIVVRVK